MTTLAHIFRHPVKGLGAEELNQADLKKGNAMPFDRRWAVAHGDADGITSWAPPKNFVNQTHCPRFAQIKTAFTERNHMLSLSHPDRPDIDIQIGSVEGDDALSEWIEPLCAGTMRTPPFMVYTIPDVAFTDFEDTHISIASEASRRALSEKAGVDLQHIRFRMNLWLDDLPPYTELEMVGQEIEIGETRLKITGRDKRCNATAANPNTGHRDINVPKLLHEEFGHMDFGVYAQVMRSGRIRPGDEVSIL